MTITARHARRQLSATGTLLGNLAPRVAQGIHDANVTMDDGGDPGGRGSDGVRRKGWISDPTAAQALGRLATHERILDDIETALETLRITTALITAWVEHHCPTLVEHPRCSGGRTVDAWSRPDCTEFVDYSVRTDGSVSYRGDGLCVACRRRKQRFETDQREAVA